MKEKDGLCRLVMTLGLGAVVKGAFQTVLSMDITVHQSKTRLLVDIIHGLDY